MSAVFVKPPVKPAVNITPNASAAAPASPVCSAASRTIRGST